jgi:hypothetical protein
MFDPFALSLSTKAAEEGTKKKKKKTEADPSKL